VSRSFLNLLGRLVAARLNATTLIPAFFWRVAGAGAVVRTKEFKAWVSPYFSCWDIVRRIVDNERLRFSHHQSGIG
jgi:hypothetical protein